MLINYLKITLRNIKKYKWYSLINIAGLAVGIAVCLLILLFVQDELSYDKHNEKADRIYRVCLNAKVGEITAQTASASAPLASALLREIPEIENAVRLRNYGFPVFYYKDKVFSETRVFASDSTIFDVFTIPFIKGVPSKALNSPNSIVITESMAKKYFGDEDPIGKTINSDKRFDYVVTGVVKDTPANSHFHFDFLTFIDRYEDSKSPVWFYNNFYTYVLLKEGADWKSVDAKFNSALIKFIKPQVEQAFQTSWESLVKQGAFYYYYLQPLTDIHLKSALSNEIEVNSDISSVYIFSIIALAVLCIACFNFMNLSTARYSGRAKEVGIRKTLGSNFAQLFRQFISESIIMVLLSVVIAVILVYIMMPVFNDISGKELSVNLFSNLYSVPFLVLLIVTVGLLAGSYPAFFLASFKPATILGSGLKNGVKGKAFRSILVIFQFAVSIVLIIGTITVYNQLDYLQTKKLGFERDQLLVVHKCDDIAKYIKAFRDELGEKSFVENVSNSNDMPGLNYGDNLYEYTQNNKSNRQLLKVTEVDYNFVNTFNVKMASGRFYSRDFGADTLNTIVINETAAKLLGLKSPVGTEIREVGIGNEDTQMARIVGVVKDFHFESLHLEIKPMALRLIRDNESGRYTFIKIKTKDLRNAVASVQSVWKKFAGNQQFEYTFFDEDYIKLYKSEERTSKLFTIFSVLAIIIGCLGLFGLAAYTAEKKTKEIGIRKVLGASINNILFMLSKEFIRWIVIANIIAWPLAYFLMREWLNDFAYRTDIGLIVFIAAGGSAVIIALAAVGYQVLKAALSNPVKSLKYE